MEPAASSKVFSKLHIKPVELVQHVDVTQILDTMFGVCTVFYCD